MTKTRIALITTDKYWLLPKKKRKAKSERQCLKNQLDDLWRRAVKIVYGKFDGNYYYCEICGKACGSGEGAGRGKGIASHHVIGKSNWNTRWEVENGTPLDGGCHTMKKDSAHQDRSAFLEKIIDKRGQEWFDRIEKKAYRDGGKKWTIKRMKQKKEELQQIINQAQ